MKKLLTIAMISLAAMAAKADLFLYWTVDVGEFTGATDAVLYAGNDTYIDAIEVGHAHDAALGNYTNYWVKLYDNAMQEIAVSATYTYSELAASNAAWNNADATSAPSGTEPFAFGGFAIPEPTSGLMLLLGLGALALKRKHV